MFFSVDCHVTDRMKFVFLQKMGWLKLVELGSLQDKFVTGQSLRKYFLIQIPVILKSMMSSSEFQSVQERLLRILVILAMAQIAVLKWKNNGSHQMIIEVPFGTPFTLSYSLLIPNTQPKEVAKYVNVHGRILRLDGFGKTKAILRFAYSF